MSDNDERIALTWTQNRVRGDDGSEIESGLEFVGTTEQFLALCESLPGFAASAFVRSLERICEEAARS